MRIKLIPLFTICLIMVGLIACDVTGEQNYDFEIGDSLNIIGGPANDTLFVPHFVTKVDTTVTPNDTSMVEAPVTTSYYSRAFTIKKDYTWTVNPDVEHSIRRDGEFIDIVTSSDDAGNYTISVDDGEYQGETTLVVVDTTSTPG